MGIFHKIHFRVSDACSSIRRESHSDPDATPKCRHCEHMRCWGLDDFRPNSSRNFPHIR
ncbi:hypothetical protein RSSM_04553 [Rhodopirellula sallentina SM41]|uniref:Uncharacterized protein n=1 Tax=Rhodopirellula sallentina SM41 TaxID=1263870 RepID=M5TXU5_9BACT|nr:hypothetical protein RSSM_04553 [Rhodopirellula sallentina SM41]